MGRRGFKPMLELLPFIPADRDEVEMLEEALHEAGSSETIAAAIPRRLFRHGELGLPPSTRTLYRRELMRLDGPPWGARSTSEALVGAGPTELSDLSADATLVPLGRRPQPILVALAHAA